MPLTPPLPAPYSGVPSSLCASLCAQSPQGAVLHDILTRALGFTLAQGSLAPVAAAISRTGLAPVLAQAEAWLAQGRLVEMHTARELHRAYFVRVTAATGRVISVLQST